MGYESRCLRDNKIISRCSVAPSAIILRANDRAEDVNPLPRCPGLLRGTQIQVSNLFSRVWVRISLEKTIFTDGNDDCGWGCVTEQPTTTF